MQAGPDYAEGLINKMRTIIRRSPHQGDADHQTPHSASLGQRLRRRLPGSPHPKPSDFHSPPNGPISSVLASSAGWAKRRPFSPIIIALFAALAVVLSLWLAGSFLIAQQETADSYYVYEKSTDPVATFTATDPEGVTPIYWSFVTAPIQGVVADGEFEDNGLFSVAGGVLGFKSPPSFETRADNGNNGVYNVVVQASDGGRTSWVQYFKATITVLDEEEDGER